MATTRVLNAIPKWILDSKEKITRSREWGQFVEELHEALEQQLRESHLSSFSDLTDAERILFLDRAAKAISNGAAYKQAYKTVSRTLDQHASLEVGRQILEENPINTRSELLLSCVEDGAHMLLHLWPDMKIKLHACFNQLLSQPIRKLLWRLFLENTKLRKKYLEILDKNPRSAISPQDKEISRQCDHLINSEATIADLKGSTGVFYGMKALLSYHHSSKKTSRPLPYSHYLLTAPFLYLSLPLMPRTKPASGEIVALLVEQYFTFMNQRPAYLKENEKDFTSAYKGFIRKTAVLLNTHSPETVKALAEIYHPVGESDAQDANTEADAFDEVATAAEGLDFLLKPLISSLFVGYLNLNSVMYVWDQFIIGMENQAFQDELMPAITAVFLILCKDSLCRCESVSALEVCLKRESGKLKPQQFQFLMQRYFYENLLQFLNDGDKSALPVLDPTQGEFSAWSQWHEDEVAPRVGPRERRVARLGRDLERKRQLEMLKEQERAREEEQEQIRQADYERYMDQAGMDRKRYEQDQQNLKLILEQEQQRHLKAEQDAEKEIEQLRLELENLKDIKRQMDAGSGLGLKSRGSLRAGLRAPAGTPASTWSLPTVPLEASSHKSVTPKRTPAPPTPLSQPSPEAKLHKSPTGTDKQAADKAGIDLLKKITEGLDKVVRDIKE